LQFSGARIKENFLDADTDLRWFLRSTFASDHQLIGKRISVDFGIVTTARVPERLSTAATFRIADATFYLSWI
jgi:hypothetical protein